jgi:hypothetical protein
VTEQTQLTSVQIAADGEGSERQASLQERQQLDEENARLERAACKAVKRYHRSGAREIEMMRADRLSSGKFAS